MKNINKIVGYICLMGIASIFSVNFSIAQCPSGQTAHEIVITGGTFPAEISWSFTNSSTGDTVAFAACGTSGTSTDTVCLEDGEDYCFEAYDDWGDGWNGGTYAITDISTGAVVISGSPNNAVAGDASAGCNGSQLEETNCLTVGVIAGCTDSTAANYNPLATLDDGSCLFPGCTDPTALNFDSTANLDDGSCTYPVPMNDLCANATAIACGDSVSGTTLGASADTTLGTCVTNLSSASGVWFAFPGNGTPVTASLCGSSYDTKIGVFEGTCDSVICITGNDDACGLQSEVTFNSTIGVDYYIYVTGFSTQSGEYQLAITCGILGCTNPTATNFDSTATIDDGSCVFPPANDDCANASAIACGDTITGTTLGANPASVSTCGTSLNTAAGVWYEFAGNGDTVTASLCGSAYDTKIGVFTGSCDSLICVTGNDDACGLQSEVDFVSVSGETYYILVTGFSTNAGDYTLAVSCKEVGFCPPGQTGHTITVDGGAFPAEIHWILLNSTTGDTVASALCGSLTSGITIDTVCLDNGADYCFEAYDDWGDGWNGGTYSIAQLSNGVELISGAPNDGTAGDGSDLCDGSQLEETSCLTVGIIAGCTDPLASNFNPNATVDDSSCVFAPANDDCDGAVDLTVGIGPCINGAIVTNSGATFSASAGPVSPACVDFGFNMTPSDIWLEATFTDSVLIFEILNQPGFSTVVELYAGVCDTLVKVDSAFCTNFGNNQPLTITGVPGVRLFFRIWDFGNDQFGDFEICAYSPAPPPVNDSCSNAISIACGDTVSGQTNSASSVGSPDSICGTSLNTANGTWYKVSGTGGDITASLCGSTFDTKLGVFEGTCGQLVCIGGNDDACGLQSEVTWTSMSGTEYLIYVTGFGTGSGVYSLAVSCETVVPTCPTPTNLSVEQVGSNSAVISWDPVPQANRYVVRGFVTGTPGLVFLITSDFTSSANIAGLTPGVDYWWQVQSVCDSSIFPPVSPFSVRDTFSIESCPPVTLNSTSNITATSATAAWFPVPGAFEYVIYANRVGTNGISTFTVPAPQTVTVGNNLLPNTTYRWAVRVRCSPGGPLSDFSPIEVFTTLAAASKSDETSIVDLEETTVKLYPNPATDQIQLNFTNLNGVQTSQISLIDLKGQVVYQDNLQINGNNVTLQLPSNLSEGVYQVQMALAERLYQERLVIMRK